MIIGNFIEDFADVFTQFFTAVTNFSDPVERRKNGIFKQPGMFFPATVGSFECLDEGGQI
jgi:hypothetical protein